MSVVFNAERTHMLTYSVSAEDWSKHVWLFPPWDGRYPGRARVLTAAGDDPHELGEPGNGVYTARFSPDGKRVLTAWEDGTVRVHDLQGRQQLRLYVDPLRMLGGIHAFRAVYAPDGEHIAAIGSPDPHRRTSIARLCVWTSKGAPVGAWELPQGVYDLGGFDADGEHVLARPSPVGWANERGKPALVYDLRGREVLRVVPEGGWIKGASFAPDGPFAMVTRTKSVTQGRELSTESRTAIYPLDGGAPTELEGAGWAEFSRRRQAPPGRGGARYGEGDGGRARAGPGRHRGVPYRRAAQVASRRLHPSELRASGRSTKEARSGSTGWESGQA